MLISNKCPALFVGFFTFLFAGNKQWEENLLLLQGYRSKCGWVLVAAMGMRAANCILSLLPPAHCYLASQSSQMFVCILRLLETAGDVKQSHPMLGVCYILLPCENQKQPEVAQQHCLTFHSRKGLRCQKVTRHENLFTHNKTSVWLRPLESQA